MSSQQREDHLRGLIIQSRRTLLLLLFSALFACPLNGQSSAPPVPPPMGWNSWNHFGKNVSDENVRSAADALVSTGLRDAGYIYVNIDDAWQGERDAKGNIQGNSKFKDMKALADYVHSKGLKIGIYSSPGPKTCAGFEGSYGHEQQDATTYAAWGMDFLKYDLCSYGAVMRQQSGGDILKGYALMREAYQKMHLALVATGRPILYSLCQYGDGNVWEWGPSVGATMWRTTGDISAKYDSMALLGFSQSGLESYASPGHYNDPDMLEVGNGLTRDESVTHMTLWAMLAAPLLAGNDLSTMTPETVSLLSNRDVLAVDQDSLAKQGRRLSEIGPLEVWVRPLANGDAAVALFNRGIDPAVLHFKPSALGMSHPTARDLWTHKDLGPLPDDYSALLPRHGAVMIRVSGKSN